MPMSRAANRVRPCCRSRRSGYLNNRYYDPASLTASTAEGLGYSGIQAAAAVNATKFFFPVFDAVAAVQSALPNG